MEREVRRGGEAPLDILVVDAFSGDSIPVHLLTREAWEVYFHRLQPNGILAVHISNRYLDLWPVTARLAESFRRECLLMRNPLDLEKHYHTAYWVLVSDNHAFLSRMRLSEAALNRTPRPSIPLWTDQFSNLLQVLF